VKLVDEHQTPPRAIGYLEATTPTDAGTRGAFHVAETPDGDRALADAVTRARDAFSVELHNVTFDAAGGITDALVTAVAFCVTPAFPDARADLVAASLSTEPDPGPANQSTTPGRTPPTMTPEQIARLAELLAEPDRTPELDTELAELLALAGPDPATVVADPATDTPTDVPAVAASLPAGVPAPTTAGNTARPIREFFAAQSRVLTGRSVARLEAALSPVTNTANIWTAPDAYAGELWSGVVGSRRYVDMMSPGTLTSWKGTGWRWVVRPAVADYPGDKTPVPSNAPTTEAAPYTAQRLAGAHDLDRKFWDFGDTEFIASYYAGLSNSYAALSNIKARAFLIASAEANPLVAAAGSTMLDLALAAKLTLESEDDVTGLSYGSPDWYLVNATDYAELLDTSAHDVSAFLELLGVTPDNFTPTTAVDPGQVCAGVRPASTFYELPGSPIRVETVDLANGGIDGGVFGYYATLLNAPEGVVSATAAP
jgi:hypothetical protein